MARKYKMLIGIDPGASGGIAHMLYDRDTQHGLKITAIKMPQNIIEFDQYIKYLIYETKNSGHALLIEKIQMFSGSARNPGMVMRMQKLLAHYNKILSSIQIAKINYQELTPMQWQRHFNHKVIFDRTERKNYFKNVAANKFKTVVPTLATADALCILEYLRLMYNNNKKITECPIPTSLL